MSPLTIHIGDALAVLRTLASDSINCCVTSPPYWGLRNYKVANQLGQEATPQEYVSSLVAVLAEVRRVLRDDGTLWLNLGDSYARQAGDDATRATPKTGQACVMAASAGREGLGNNRPPLGLKLKDLVGIPWRVAFALQADGWYLRQDVIWHKPNPMPESVRDRCTKAHEYLFLLSKSERYYWDWEAMQEAAVCPRKRGPALHADLVSTNGNSGLAQREPRETRNRRSVWSIPTVSYKEAHFATFPPALITPCILAGCPVGGMVLDPFAGSGTTGQVALDNARFATLIELNPAYAAFIHKRCSL